MDRKRLFVRILLHVLPWTILMLGPYLVLFQRDMPKILIERALTVHVFMIGIFYLNYLVYIPRLLFKKRFTAYGITVVLTVIFIALVNYLAHRFILMTDAPLGLGVNLNETVQVVNKVKIFIPPFFPPAGALILMGIGVAIRITNRWMRQDKDIQAVQQERLATELAFLKNQINPHFFFNTLNNIYALTGTEPEQARMLIHKLSKMMRYLLYETEKTETVTLGMEIRFLKAFIEITQARLSETVKVRFEHDAESEHIPVPPLLFIPFVENAFKHGISYQQESRITITLHQRKGQIEFSVINTVPNRKFISTEVGGVGLTNIRRRLELLYPNREYSLEITPSPDYFDVQLKIPVHETPVHRH